MFNLSRKDQDQAQRIGSSLFFKWPVNSSEKRDEAVPWLGFLFRKVFTLFLCVKWKVFITTMSPAPCSLSPLIWQSEGKTENSSLPSPTMHSFQNIEIHHESSTYSTKLARSLFKKFFLINLCSTHYSCIIFIHYYLRWQSQLIFVERSKDGEK